MVTQSSNVYRDALLTEDKILGEKLQALKNAVAEYFLARTIEPPAFRVLVNLITWWTLVIEGLLAVVWLLPARSLAGRQRHWLMVLFCVSTYAVATVAGFGWLIVAMAVTTLRVEQTRLAFLYLLSFALILVFKHVPIWSLIGAS